MQKKTFTAEMKSEIKEYEVILNMYKHIEDIYYKPTRRIKAIYLPKAIQEQHLITSCKSLIEFEINKLIDRYNVLEELESNLENGKMGS